MNGKKKRRLSHRRSWPTMLGFCVAMAIGPLVTPMSAQQNSGNGGSPTIQAPNLQYSKDKIQPKNQPPKPHSSTGLAGSRANAEYASGAEMAICAILPNCKPPAPVITGYFPFSFLTPGGYVVIYGKLFNGLSTTGGKVRFSLGGTVHDLVDLTWSDTAVGGRVTDGWNWPFEDPVDLWLERADGAKSNILSPRPTFQPTYEVVTLPWSDLSETHCAPSDDYNCSPSANYWPDATVAAYHGTTYGHDSGTDYYKMQHLWNGWRTYDVEFDPGPNHDGTVQQPSGFAKDAKSIDIQVHWDQDGGSILAAHLAKTTYRIRLLIHGPKYYPWTRASWNVQYDNRQ